MLCTVGFLFYSPSGCSAAVPVSLLVERALSQARGEASVRCLVCTLSAISSAGFKYKGIFHTVYFPIFINISDIAECKILMNQVDFWGYIKKLFLFQ